jgi:hypothetical protein
VLLGVIVGLAVIAVAVLGGTAPHPDVLPATRKVEVEDAAAAVTLSLDTLDASRGGLKIRVSVLPGTDPLPPEGATLLMDLPGVGAQNLPLERFAPDKVSDVVVDSGDVNDYPFDAYKLRISLALVKGHDATGPGRPEDQLPVNVGVTNGLAGFQADVEGREVDGQVQIDLDITRSDPVLVWVLAMMGFYWLLAICAVGVVLATVLKLKEFETRHLAWLGTMIFAFAAFRNTAPGSPPIGVYLDFSAFFWAEFLLAVSLMALVAFYLTGNRGVPKPAATPDVPERPDASDESMAPVGSEPPPPSGTDASGAAGPGRS